MYGPYLLTYLDVLGFKHRVESLDAAQIDAVLQRLAESADPGKDPPYDTQFLNFSDTSIRATRLDPPDKRKRPNGLMFYEVFNVGLLQIDLIRNSVFLRGSMTVGPLQLEQRKIFGPVLNRAYYLESEVAVYPRIIIDPELIKMYCESDLLWGDHHDYES